MAIGHYVYRRNALNGCARRFLSGVLRGGPQPYTMIRQRAREAGVRLLCGRRSEPSMSNRALAMAMRSGISQARPNHPVSPSLTRWGPLAHVKQGAACTRAGRVPLL
jgi:hypothetical protein